LVEWWSGVKENQCVGLDKPSLADLDTFNALDADILCKIPQEQERVHQQGNDTATPFAIYHFSNHHKVLSLGGGKSRPGASGDLFECGVLGLQDRYRW
jgi:hypothetical protein